MCLQPWHLLPTIIPQCSSYALQLPSPWIGRLPARLRNTILRGRDYLYQRTSTRDLRGRCLFGDHQQHCTDQVALRADIDWICRIEGLRLANEQVTRRGCGCQYQTGTIDFKPATPWPFSGRTSSCATAQPTSRP